MKKHFDEIIDREHCAFYIAAADDDGPVKIGISADPDRRVIGLQTGSAKKLSMIAVYWLQTRTAAARVERKFLELFARDCMNGEWINRNVDDVFTAVDALIQQYSRNKLVPDDDDDVGFQPLRLMSDEKIRMDFAAAQLGFGG